MEDATTFSQNLQNCSSHYLMEENNMRFGEEQRRRFFSINNDSLQNVCEKSQAEVSAEHMSQLSNKEIEPSDINLDQIPNVEETKPYNMTPDIYQRRKKSSQEALTQNQFSQIITNSHNNYSPSLQFPNFQVFQTVKTPMKGAPNFTDYQPRKLSNFQKPSVYTISSQKQIPITSPGGEKIRNPTKKSTQKGMSLAWKRNAIIILSNIVKFIACLQGMSKEHRFTKLDRVKLDIIGDVSYHYDFYKFNGYMKKDKPSKFAIFYQNFTQRMYKTIPCGQFNEEGKSVGFIIYPESIAKLVWDIILLVSLLGCVVFIPLKLSFQDNESFQPNQYLDFFLDTLPQYLFLLDIILKFNTAFYEKGSKITNRVKIAKQYINNGFYFDFILTFTYFLNLSLNIKYLDGILILRFKQILNNSDYLSDLLNMRSTQKAMFNLLKLIVIISFIAHFCGCTFIIIGNNQEDPEETWLGYDDMVHKKWYDQYIAAFYFSVITMNTVGYGDIHPKTSTDRVVTVFLTILSCGVFAYSLDELGNIFRLIGHRKSEFKENQAILVFHMKQKGVNSELQNRVKKYYEYIYQENLEEKEKGDTLINKLPESLRKEIQFECNLKLLQEQAILTQNFSQEVIYQIARQAEEKRIGPEHVIFEEGKTVDTLYFLKSGNIELSQKVGTKKVFIKSIKREENVGILWFFNNQASSITAKTQNVVTILSISKEQFLNILGNHKKDFEVFSMMKDNVMYYKSNRLIYEKCHICNFSNHNESTECPFINFVPNQYQIINKCLQDDSIQIRQDQEKKYERKQEKCGNYKTYFHVVKDACLCYLFENYPDFDHRELLRLKTFEPLITKNLPIKTMSKSYSNINFNMIQNSTSNNNNESFLNRKDLYNNLNEDNFSESSSGHQYSSSQQVVEDEFQNTPNSQKKHQNFSFSQQLSIPQSIQINQTHTSEISSESSVQSRNNQRKDFQRKQSYVFSTNNISNKLIDKINQQRDQIAKEDLYQQQQQFIYNDNYTQKSLNNNTQSNQQNDLEQSVNSQMQQSKHQRKKVGKQNTVRTLTMKSQDARRTSYYQDNSSVYYDNTNKDYNNTYYGSETTARGYEGNQDTYCSYGGQSYTQQPYQTTTFRRLNTYGTLAHTNFDKSTYAKTNTQFGLTQYNMINLSKEDHFKLRGLKNLNGENMIQGFEQKFNFEFYFTRGNLDNILKIMREKKRKQKITKIRKGQSEIIIDGEEGERLEHLKRKFENYQCSSPQKKMKTRYRSSIMDKLNSVNCILASGESKIIAEFKEQSELEQNSQETSKINALSQNYLDGMRL